jgi:hypothetical protein
VPVILATWETEIRMIMVPGQLRQIVHKTPLSKITRAKWTADVAQEAKYLLCKHKVLSSNPRPNNNNNKDREREELKSTIA